MASTLFDDDAGTTQQQDQKDPTWADYGRVLESGTASIGAAGEAAGRYLHELLGDDAAAQLNAAHETSVHHSMDDIAEAMTPVARERWQAAVTDPKFWEHPVSSSALKATGMAPALVAAALPGGLTADVMAATAGSALVGGALNSSQGLDDFYSRLEKYDDKKLQDESDLYRGLRLDHSEADARSMYDVQVQGLKPAINFLVGAAASAVGPAAGAARKLAGGSAVLGAGESGVVKRVALGAAEGGVGGGAQSGVSDYTTQAALQQGGVQKEFDPHEFAAAVAEGSLVGGLAGGAVGVLPHGGGSTAKADTKTDTPSVALKGYGTGNVAPPRADADVGNPQSAPTRSEKTYPKDQPGGGEGAKITTVDAAKPDDTQASALQNSAATNQPTPPPDQIAAAAQRVAQSQPPPKPAAPPEPAPAPQPAIPPKAAEAVRRVRDAQTPQPEPVETATADVTPQAEPIAAAPVEPLKPVQAPIAEVPRAPRILRSETPESRAAAVQTAEAIKRNLAGIQKSEQADSGEAAPVKSHKSAADQDAAKARDDAAQQRIDAHTPAEGETDDAVLARAKGMVDAAGEQGLEIPKRLKGEKSAGITTLREAADLVRATTTKSWAANKKYRTDALTRFRTREAAARAGDTGEALASRRAEGDEVKRISQGNVEDKAAVTPEVIEGAGGGTGTARIKVRDGDTAESTAVRLDNATEEAVIKTKSGKTEKVARAKAASEVRKVALTPEQKADIEQRANASLTPKTAEAKAAISAKPTKAEEIKQRIATLKKEIAEGAKDTDTNPTEGQKRAGNYKKGDVALVRGLKFKFENPKGSTRSGEDANGKKWSVEMKDHYGEFADSEGADGDKVDGFLGPHPESDHVMVIDQHHLAGDKAFDEHKVMFGYKDGADAVQAYERAFSGPGGDGKGFDRIGKITAMSVDQFKKWVHDRKATSKPAEEPTAPGDAKVTPGVIEPSTEAALQAGGPKQYSPKAPEGVKPLYTMKAAEALDSLDLSTLPRAPQVLASFFKGKLKRLAGDTDVHILSGEDMERYRGEAMGQGTTRGLHVQFDNGNNRVLLRADQLTDEKSTAHIVLHEVAHAATARVLYEDPHLFETTKRIMAEVQASLHELPNPAFDYAMTNPVEFVAEAFSNPAMQESLAQMPASSALMRRVGAGSKSSMWDMVVGLVRTAIERIVGPLPQSHSMIDAIMRLGSRLEDAHVERTLDERANGPRDLSFHPEAARLVGRSTEAAMSGAISGSRESVAELSSKPVSDLVDAVKRVTGAPDAKPLLKRIGNMLTTNDQFRQQVEHLVPHAKPIFDMIERQGVAANNLKKAGTRIAADMIRAVKLDPENFAKFATIVNEQTAYGVDASARIGEGRNSYLALSKDNLDAQKAGTLDPAAVNSAHWAAHGAHPRLSAEYKALVATRPEYAALQNRLFDFFKESQTSMARSHVEEYLRAAGIGDRRDALVRSIVASKLTGDLREKLTKDYGDAVAKQIIQAKALTGSEGPYSPLMRHGDFVVGGKYKVAEPKNALHKVDDSTWQFKTRQQAHQFAESTGLHYDAKTVYYDPTTGERTTKIGGEALTHSPEQRWEIHVERNHLEFHATEAEALAGQKTLHETGELEAKPYVEKKQDYIGREQEIGAGTLTTMLRKLHQTDEYRRATDAQKSDMARALAEAALVTRAGNRIQSRRLPRRRVRGASDDLVRNMVIYNDSQANYRAKIRFRPQIEDQLQQMHKFVTDSRYDARQALDPNTLKRSEVANEITQRARTQDPNEYTGGYTDWMKRVTAWSYIDRMARPSHLILHQTHLPMITAPIVAGRHGALRTYVEMARAWKQAIRTYKAGAYDFVKSIGDNLHEGTDFQKSMKDSFKSYEDGARIGKMFDALADIGLIHPQAGLEVNKFMPSRQMGGALGALDKSIGYVDTVFRHATNATEAINRYVGAAMAYRLEYAKGIAAKLDPVKAHDKAVQYARDTLANTQGFYSATNAAPLFKNKIIRPFLQFKQFPQMMYHLLISTAHTALRGATTSDRVQAAASLIAVLTAHSAMTGLLGGLPLEAAKIAGLVSKGLGITDGDWTDVERAAYEKAVGLFGREGADYVMHGAARHLFGVDVHHRLGLNSFFTFGLPAKPDKKSVSTFVLDQALGAPEGLAEDTFTGINQMMHGDIINGAAKVLPAQALRDVIRAWHGGPPSDKYKYSGGETAARVLGFTPTGEAQQGERAAEMSQLKGEYTDKRNALIKGWVSGADKLGAWTEIQKFNAKLPPQSRITMSQLQEAKTRQGKALQSGANYLGVSFTKQTKFIADRDRALY